MKAKNEIIPCSLPRGWKVAVATYAEALRAAAPTIGNHGFDPKEFHEIGLFDSAIERIRGQKSATTKIKQDFIKLILGHLKSKNLIDSWSFQGSGERHDFVIDMRGKTVVVEAKGCLDGNNTNIFERPKNADEFYIWSLCQNIGSDMRHNVRSGIHTRLSAEIIHRNQLVDGLIVWDMFCGNKRPCPKIEADATRMTRVSTHDAPPPCLYMFPRQIPSARNNPKPPVHRISELKFFEVLSRAFKATASDLVQVEIEARIEKGTTERMTTCTCNGSVIMQSKWTPIKRAT